MSGLVIPFPCNGRTVRAICIVPDGPSGADQCRAVLGGFPLDGGEEISFSGPLWQVQMLAKDHRQGLPIRVHPACLERAGL